MIHQYYNIWCFWALAYLKRKSDTFAAFKAYKAYAENCLGLRIKATWDNKGGKCWLQWASGRHNGLCQAL